MLASPLAIACRHPITLAPVPTGRRLCPGAVAGSGPVVPSRGGGGSGGGLAVLLRGRPHGQDGRREAGAALVGVVGRESRRLSIRHGRWAGRTRRAHRCRRAGRVE